MTETTDQVVERLARNTYELLTCGCGRMTCKFCESDLEKIEAALREALRIGREQAAQVADRWAKSQSCSHDDNPCCHVRTGAGIAAAIRNLSTEE